MHFFSRFADPLVTFLFRLINHNLGLTLTSAAQHYLDEVCQMQFGHLVQKNIHFMSAFSLTCFPWKYRYCLRVILFIV
jgi:hypothetical protein